MSQRGRGTLEVAPSRNPFFQTTSSDVGPKTRDRIDWKYDVNPSLVSTNTYNNDGNFSFLYTRTSDAIGSKIPQPQSDTLKMMTRTEFLKKRREELVASGAAATAAELQPAEPPRACAEDILKTYKHVPKLEDPRYTTSNVGVEIVENTSFSEIDNNFYSFL